ncbi:DNA polymerase I B, chloroplastic/mitochondrial-like [Cucurbita pepo subsp. pepo]|uniref:DNA polymerase I B, chloroplastic/mitochondrial-like n=1 Tax=Cucurbita pepo subsp. pepo TaxID=3664 RepID=UPI000C9DA201|nr:DNA polymerase I B, chloroplastic/mitochondrial-like [Cucurbita pepo subsp. pepo]
MMTLGVSSSQASSLRAQWPAYFFLWRSNSVSSSSISFCASSKALCRAEFGPLKSVGGVSSNMKTFHASCQCRQSSFLSTNSFVETRQYDNERAFLSDVKAWSKSTMRLKEEKHLRFMETEILTTNDEEKLRNEEHLIGYGTSHSKIQSNLGSKLSNANKDSDCINPSTNMLSDGFRKQGPMSFEQIQNVETIEGMIISDRTLSLDTIKVSSDRCNGNISSYSGEQTMTKPANNDLHNQVIPMQSNKNYTFSQNGNGSIMHRSPNVSPNGRKQSIPLGKMDSVPKTLKLTEAANGLKRGAAVEEFSKMTINGGGTKITEAPATNHKPDIKERLNGVYDSVLVVDSIHAAREIVSMLTMKYRNLVHACDTEVAKIDVKQETPVDHGEIICFSIYSGPTADFGNGKSCIWVDVLDGGGKEILLQFAPFFEDPSIRKVWHNYSFDNHIIENYGIKVSGFHADTMHMARLWDSSRRINGGYSLEALSGDTKVMSGAKLGQEKELIGKISMKTIFGRKKMKKDGSEGKIIVIPPVEELQREEKKLWVSYSALDSICTLKLYESLKNKLSDMPWERNGEMIPNKTMFNFYEEYWQPFGELLIKMETEGMLVDRPYLAKIEKLAIAEQQVAANRFRNWASKYCPDARHMNVGSDAQLRQLLFGGTSNSKNPDESLPTERTFKVPNTENVIEEGKKTPSKFRNITLKRISVEDLSTEMYTATGWPSVSGDALKVLAGKVSAEYDYFTDDLQSDNEFGDNSETMFHEENKKHIIHESANMSDYGTALKAFGSSEKGREACHAIAALCEVCSIDSLISNFILPLQGSNISGKNGRIHCSLNINTETGRLSARRPNLQNQPALEKDRYKIRQAFIAAPGNSLIVADYGQLELRILAHLANCKSMLEAFKAGGDFHSRTAMNMYPHIRKAVEDGSVLLEWDPQPGEDKPPVPLLKDAFGSERRKAKMLNFSIAYGKTPVGLSKDWKVTVEEAKQTVDLWYNERKEVRTWQNLRKREAEEKSCVRTLLGRARRFPSMTHATRAHKGHIERAAINTPVQGSAADVAMCAMLEISKNSRLRELGWRLLLQVHDEVILEGPTESAEVAKAIVVECMSKPFNGKNILNVDLAVDAKCARNWYSAK